MFIILHLKTKESGTLEGYFTQLPSYRIATEALSRGSQCLDQSHLGSMVVLPSNACC